MSGSPLTGGEMKDEEILRRSFNDPSYFAALIERYEEAFLRAAIAITRSREEAEDILQETFTKIYTYGKRYKEQPGATFKSWAYKILINTSFTHYQRIKKKGGNVEYLDPVLYEDSVVTEGREIATASDNKKLIEETLKKIPEHLGRLLKLYYLEDKSYNDIAEIEKISLTTLKMRLFRAKRLFKKAMTEQ